MTSTSFEIRRCDSCGLRYPLVSGHPHGTRCPACMGDTRVILTRKLVAEPDPSRPSILNREGAKAAKNHKRGEEKNTKPSRLRGENRFSVLLDNVRSAWNVGSIFRSADGFGFVHAYLCGISPTPENEAVTKTSLGAEDSVPWSYHRDSVKLVKGLKKEGYKICALEEDERAIALHRASTSTSSRYARSASAQREILIVGNEVTGVDPELLDLCDEIFYLPMRGEKKSFNVAIAFSIAAYALKTDGHL